MEQQREVENFLGQLRAAIRVKSPPRLDVPALVLASVGDNLVSWRCSEAIAKRLALPLKLHEGTGTDAAGHDLPLDAPDWVCAQVNAWTATLPLSRQAEVPAGSSAPRAG